MTENRTSQAEPPVGPGDAREVGETAEVGEKGRDRLGAAPARSDQALARRSVRSVATPGGDPQKSLRVRPRLTMAQRIDAVMFCFAGASVVWLAYLLLSEGVRPGWPLLLLVVFWVVTTYLLLPRLHRILTQLYVPGYFIGRARTSDGLLGDPVNLALLGHEAQVHRAMTAAGWTRAHDLSLATGRRIVTSTLARRSYAEAPVSPLHLFDRQQDFAYQQEVAGSPSKRHHVRFWRCPDDWMLPGGYPVDWLAAGTYDRSVGLSLFTLQITHKIEANTDVERDFIVQTVLAGSPECTVEVIENFSTGYHSRNGGGDLIETDGDLPVLDLRPLPVAPVPAAERTDSRDQRPVQIVFGSLVAILRGALYFLVGPLLFIVAAIAPPSELEGVEPVLLVLLGVAFVLLGLVDVALGIATLAGRTLARLLLMGSAVVSTVIAFVSHAQGERVTLATNLPTVGLSIFVLLALSSHRARAWSARARHLSKRKRRRRAALPRG